MIKIIGERNTGTNYLSKLIKKNLNIKLLNGTAKKIPLFSKLEFYKDLYFKITQKNNLGWKHANLNNKNFINGLRKNSKIKVVILVKNPYSFLLSLKKRPYHNFNLKNLPFEVFLKSKWKSVSRENTLDFIESPVELWNNKVRSYFLIKSIFLEQVLILKYEDLIINPAFQLKKICDMCKVDFSEHNFLNIKNSTKKDSKTFNDYLKYYKNDLWIKKLSNRNIKTINEKLDLKLLNKLNYRYLDGK